MSVERLRWWTGHRLAEARASARLLATGLGWLVTCTALFVALVAGGLGRPEDASWLIGVGVLGHAGALSASVFMGVRAHTRTHRGISFVAAAVLAVTLVITGVAALALLFRVGPPSRQVEPWLILGYATSSMLATTWATGFVLRGIRAFLPEHRVDQRLLLVSLVFMASLWLGVVPIVVAAEYRGFTPRFQAMLGVLLLMSLILASLGNIVIALISNRTAARLPHAVALGRTTLPTQASLPEA